jgi:hypothetical protein
MTWSEKRRSVTVPLLAFLLVLSSVVLVSPAGSVEVDPAVDGTVLVVAPHPDDDVITAAGITYERPDTVIAFMTNGDSHSRSEDGTIATVVNPSTFTYTGADLSDIDNNPPLGIAITLAGNPIPFQRTITVIDKALKKITLNAPVTGLAPGATFETDAFTPVEIAETRQAEAVSAQTTCSKRCGTPMPRMSNPERAQTTMKRTHHAGWEGRIGTTTAWAPATSTPPTTAKRCSPTW